MLKHYIKSLIKKIRLLTLSDDEKHIHNTINELLSLVNANNLPNINQLWLATKDIDIIRLNIKNFGYQLAVSLQPYLQSLDCSQEPKVYGIVSKPTTQKDIESPWFKYWCNELKAMPIYHRKLWEYAFLLQALYEHGMLQPGREGIGFGCGEEPMASYFALKGIKSVVTDLDPAKVAGLGWAETGQHTSNLDKAFHPYLVSHNEFVKYVEHCYIDMNHIPKFNKMFDFCWSICAMEHIGSIQSGIEFVENSLAILKPGGVAVHTTEYNYLSIDKTIDNWPTVLFLRSHFEALFKRLSDKGHHMLGPDFEIGKGILDKFIDVPPYSLDDGWYSTEGRSNPNKDTHLKLSIDGFASTCFGIIIKKSS